MGPWVSSGGEKDGYWEVDIYPTPVELIGGAEDGAVVSPAFSLDPRIGSRAFEEVEDFGWTTIGWPDGNGPFVWIKGSYQGHELLLRILAQAPEGRSRVQKLRMPEAPQRGRTTRSKPPAGARLVPRVSAQPRPTKGAFSSPSKVMKRALARRGRLAM